MERRDDADEAGRARTRSRWAASGATTRDFCSRPGRRRVRGQFNFNAVRHRAFPPTRRRHGRARQLVRVVPARLAERRPRDLKVIDKPGTQALGGVRSSSRTSGRRVPSSRRPRPALGVLHAARGLEAQGSLSNYDPLTTRCAPPATAREREHRRQGHVHELQPADWARRGRFNEKTVLRAGYGASTIVPFPDNRYASTSPSSRTIRARQPTGSRPPARWQRDSRRRRSWTFRRMASSRCPARSSTRRSTSSPRACTKPRCTRGTWPCSGSCPFNLTADIAYVGNRGVDLVMDIDGNASLVYGSGNVGRPQFAHTIGPGRRASAATTTSPSTTRCR